jgi:hypothetical protein
MTQPFSLSEVGPNSSAQATANLGLRSRPARLCAAPELRR